MKIVVDKMPEESYKCIFAHVDFSVKASYESIINCTVDGRLCDLEIDCCCEKLITLEDLTNGRD